MAGFPTTGVRRGRQNIHERAAIQQGGRLAEVYEEHEFNVPGLADDDSLTDIIDHAMACTCEDAAFDKVPVGTIAEIRNVGASRLTFKFVSEHDGTPHPVTVEDGERYHWTWTSFTDILISNASASPVAVRITLT